MKVARRRRHRAEPLWCQGWLREARWVRSPNQGERPTGMPIELAVLHSISLPPGRYGGPAVERFFTNRLEAGAHPYFSSIAELRVSAHFLLRRDGSLIQFVAVPARAWHAGASAWRGRTQCNDWSVGIEFEGLEGRRFDARQYRAAARLLRQLAQRWPLCEVVGHEDVAPGRKADPGPGFDWQRLARQLRGSGLWLRGRVRT